VRVIRDELFREACRLAVETGGFRMSLIGMRIGARMKDCPCRPAGKDEGPHDRHQRSCHRVKGAPTTMVARDQGHKWRLCQ
jgi:hypothetical protein